MLSAVSKAVAPANARAGAPRSALCVSRGRVALKVSALRSNRNNRVSAFGFHGFQKHMLLWLVKYMQPDHQIVVNIAYPLHAMARHGTCDLSFTTQKDTEPTAHLSKLALKPPCPCMCNVAYAFRALWRLGIGDASEQLTVHSCCVGAFDHCRGAGTSKKLPTRLPGRARTLLARTPSNVSR